MVRGQGCGALVKDALTESPRSLGQTQFDYPQPGAGTLTQRHGRLIETEIRRVESVCGPGHPGGNLVGAT
jgi:hypothetical protein